MSEITIIIPLYNAVRHLKMTLDSVVAQTYQDFEVLLINDGSTDNTEEMVIPYCEKYQNFHLITQKNGGVSAARNRGLEETHTPYVAFLDQDDILHPQALEILYQMIKKYDADVSAFEIEVVPDDFSGHKNMPDFDILNLLLHSEFSSTPIKFFFTENRGIYPHIWDKLYRLEAIKRLRFPLDIQPAEDTCFALETFLTIKNIVFTDEKLLYYRVKSKALTPQVVTEKYIRSYALAAEVMNKFFYKLENVSRETQECLDLYLTRFIYNFLILQILRLENIPQREKFWEISSDYVKELYRCGALKLGVLNFRKNLIAKLFMNKYFRLAAFFIRGL